MARPAGYQWAPLGLDADPVPGDPAAITQEASHLSSVATMISQQVTALHTISDGGTDEVLKGKYADKIRSSASSLAGELGKILGRYQKVSSALTGYVPDLEQAQSMSLTALDDAQGPAAQLGTLQGQTVPSGQNLTAAQKQQVTDHKNAVSKARGALADAQQLLGKATGLRDTSASHCASLIHSASDDSMKDHWSLWGAISGFVSHFAGWIKTICTILEVIGTILAVAAFIIAQFIPGLDVLVDALVLAAFLTTAGATLGRLLLAATGNGSWWDFAIDAFACLTFGLGKVVGAALKTVALSSEDAGRGLVLGERALAISKGEAQLARVASMFDDQALCRITVKFMARVDELYPALEEAPEKVARLKLMQNLAGLSEQDLKSFSRIVTVSQRFAGSDADNAALAGRLVKALGGIGGAGLGLGTFSGLGGGIVLGPDQDHPWIDWRIPGLSHFYDGKFEFTTGGH